MFDEAEIEHLDEVVVGAEPAHEDVGGLDVAVDQAAAMRLAERVADLPQQMDRPRGLERTEFPHGPLEADPVEQLHHVIEVAVLGDAEVVHVDGVGGAERGRVLGFALETADDRLA